MLLLLHVSCRKRCLESRLPRDLTHMADSKDPYEFNVVDSQAMANSKQAKAKPKPLTTNKMSKPRDISGLRSPTGLFPSVNRLQSPTLNSMNASKRKRSGTATLSAVGGPPTINISSNLSSASANPISIAIPGSISLNVTLTSSTLSNLNATIAASKQAQLQNQNRTSSNVLKDLSIVVTNIDTNIMNGHLVSIPGSTLVDGTQLQLNNLPNAQPDKTKLHKKGSKSKKLHNQDVHSKVTTSLTNTMGIVNSLGQQQTAILASPFMLNTGGHHVVVTNNTVTSSATNSPPSAAPSPIRSVSMVNYSFGLILIFVSLFMILHTIIKLHGV